MALEYRPLTDDEKQTILAFREDIDHELAQLFKLTLKGEWVKAGEVVADLTMFFFVLGKDLA